MEDLLKLPVSKIKENSATLQVPGSKSIANRWLILKALYQNIELKNLSIAKDTQVLEAALQSDSNEINIGHAGTAMRFLTAYFAATTKRNIFLKGSERMHQRPIHPLVDALNAMGAKISYAEKEGYPPLRIAPCNGLLQEVEIPANISSQYITALLLIASSLPNGLKINLKGKITSWPYIQLTLDILKELGVTYKTEENSISVEPLKTAENKVITVESDWSSASYWFAAVALSKVGTQLKLTNFHSNSSQGDAQIVPVFEQYFGVKASFESDGLWIQKVEDVNDENEINLELNAMPDMAQTFAVLCGALKIKAHFTGLETLKIKETDRLVALKNELGKLGVETKITEDSLSIVHFGAIPEKVTIKTYDDHRMALAFSVFALKTPLEIEHPNVVVKSYPNYWEQWNEIMNLRP